MIITYFGHSCFRIQDKIGPEGINLATDPFDKSIGLKVPNFEADIVTVSHSHSDHNNSKALRGNPFVVDSPGEYEIKGVMIQGISAKHDDKNGAERGDNVLYRIEIDGIAIAHLGDLGHTLSDEQLDKLDGVDILLVPVGGKYTIDGKKAAEVISQVEPRIIIPMHYKIKGLNLDVESEAKFIKELGLEPKQEEKLKISKRDLPQEGMELVVLKPL
jgi:L-ascorbate metabolism protein UlaG (beta-lactamase superfamily)